MSEKDYGKLLERLEELTNEALNHVVFYKQGFIMGVDYEKRQIELKAINFELDLIKGQLPTKMLEEFNQKIRDSRPDLFK